MQQQHSLSAVRPVRSTLRFRRWSRKGYAAFVSRKHTVTIGCLAAAVADRFYQKGLSLHRGVGHWVESLREQAEQKEQALERDQASLPLAEQERLLLLLSQKQVVACPAWVSARNVFKKRKAGMDPSGLFPPFCVYTYIYYTA